MKGDIAPAVAFSTASLVPFFDRNGLVHWEFFVDLTIKKELFLALLERVQQCLEVHRMRILLHRNALDYQTHMDNAPAHNAFIVTAGLVRMGLTKMKHPAYSLDLLPSDFFLFPYLKRILRSRQFPTVELLTLAIAQICQS